MYSIRVSTEEHADAKWVTVDDLNQYDWAPVDVPIVEQLKADTLWN
ncbi:hypothetical protein GCM10011386_38950 [Parapedobacter defluvii]|uniref:8-oxo-dGTP diphosphatase n=1 Tax=Parapedobacter defluvii TaxID=2045106 RepID=A0ABQ1MLM1_9SPHI|nr:hypothetical protein [Parapedobacter defluvii]GGC42883.1 hypothetical protein GCM10011386_38950 [Parapedobacter defluvii]